MRILVIEDEPKIANSLKRGLEQETYAVDVAYTGESGWDLASTEDYDLIILDLMLPGMSGMEIAKKLRVQKIHTPILMLTAKGQTGDKVEGLDAGADDYLTKPFAFEELLARVRAMARRPKQSASPHLSVDDLTLDPPTHEVRRGQVIIGLSSREYALLDYLMRHPGRILTKQQIIDHVWNFDANVLPNTIEVYIGYLRNKIDRPFPNKPALIRTVRGFGYRLGDKNNV